jgi:tetratricopeptide (TPR) repeat protein
MEQHEIESAFHAADALSSAGNNDGAIGKIREVLKEHPEDEHALALLSIFHLRSNRADEAIKAGEAAIAADPEYDFAHRALGWALQLKGDHASAEARFREAIRIQPDGAYNHYGFGLLMMARNRRKEAAESLERALALDPENAVFLGARAELCLSEGNVDRASDLANQALELDPDDTGALLARAEVDLRRGQLSQARESVLWVLRHEATNSRAINLLCQIKTRENPIMGLWWRWAVWMQKFSGWKAWGVVILIYLAFQLFRATLLPAFGDALQGLVVLAWFSFAVLTWVGPTIFRRMVRKELKKVSLRPDF